MSKQILYCSFNFYIGGKLLKMKIGKYIQEKRHSCKFSWFKLEKFEI